MYNYIPSADTNNSNAFIRKPVLTNADGCCSGQGATVAAPTTTIALDSGTHSKWDLLAASATTGNKINKNSNDKKLNKYLEMKKYIVTGLFLICLINANAQYKTGILIAQNFSSFRFISSDNEVSNPGYTVKFGYGFEIQREYSKNVFAEALLSYNNTGAISNADLARLEWSFQYLNVAVEAGYRFGSGRIRPISGA